MEDLALASALLQLIGEVDKLTGEAETVDKWPFRLAKDVDFREHLVRVMKRVEDTYTMARLADQLALFPLMRIPQRYDSGYDIRKKELQPDLDRTRNLLTERLKLVDFKAFLTVATKMQIAELLHAARLLKGHSREQAAHDCGVTPDAVKSWEMGRNHPSGEHRAKLSEYLESALKK